MELVKLQEALRDLFNQIDFIYQQIEDGRVINAHRQAQGAKSRVQVLMNKVREWQNELATQDNKDEPKCPESTV